MTRLRWLARGILAAASAVVFAVFVGYMAAEYLLVTP